MNFATEHKKNTLYDSLVDFLNPAILATLADKEDNPTYQEAMAGPDAAGFIEAMKQEIKILEELEVFDIVVRPTDRKVLSGVWAFRRKRYPDGSIKKLKARSTDGRGKQASIRLRIQQ